MAQANVSEFTRTADFADVNDQDIALLVQDIDAKGYAVIPDFVHEDDIQQLRVFVEEACRTAGNQYVSFQGPEQLENTALARMAHSRSFRRLCEGVYSRATGEQAPADGYYQVLRCLTGTTGAQHSMRFHYDSFVLTVLLPIHVPKGANSGDLIVFPNTRKIRKWYFQNMIDKVLIDNAATQWFLRKLAARRSRYITRIEMKPGNLYLFWGYRSIHTNEPCDIDKIRATALFHYVDPHQNSQVKRLLRA